MTKLEEFIFALICCAIIGGVLALVLHSYLSMPYVYKSWSSQECKYIEFSDGTIKGCDTVKDLKELGAYELIWIE